MLQELLMGPSSPAATEVERTVETVMSIDVPELLVAVSAADGPHCSEDQKDLLYHVHSLKNRLRSGALNTLRLLNKRDMLADGLTCGSCARSPILLACKGYVRIVDSIMDYSPTRPRAPSHAERNTSSVAQIAESTASGMSVLPPAAQSTSR